MQPDNMVKKQTSEFRSISVCGTGDKVSHLGEPINKSQDGVEAMEYWEVDNKVARD